MRWLELFEGAGRRLSMSRLLVFMAFWPACYAFVINPSESMAGVFLGAFVLNYIGGKSADIFMGSEKLAASDDSAGSNSGVAGKPLAKPSGATVGNKNRAF